MQLSPLFSDKSCQLLRVLAQLVPLYLFSTSNMAYAQTEQKPQGVIDCEKAEFAYLEQDYDEAIIYLKRCRQALPDYLPALTLMGKIQSQYERHDLAVSTFAQALEQGADAELFANIWARSLMASRNYRTIVEFNRYATFAEPVRINWLKYRAQACLALDNAACATDAYHALAMLSDDVDVSLGFAGLAMRARNWPEAHKQLTLAQEKQPGDIRVLLAKSRLALYQEQIAQAMTYVESALQIAPDDLRVLRMLVDVYLAANQQDKAVATLDILLDAAPEDPFALLVSNSLTPNAQYAAVLSRYKARIEQLTKESKADNKELYYLQGLIAYQDGSYELALQSFKQLRKLNAYYPQSLALLAKTYVALGQTAEAAKVLEIEQESLLQDAPEVMAFLIELFVEEGDIFKALPSWRNFSERYPDRIDAKLLEVKIMFGRGQNQPAMDKLKTLTRQYPQAPAIQRVYAIALTQNGEYSQAMSVVDKLLQSSPQKAPWYNFKGALFLKLGEAEKAEQALQAALQEDATLITARLNLAWLGYQRGNATEALAEVADLRARHPDHLSLRQLYAGMLLSSGEQLKAKEEYEALYQRDNRARGVIETLVSLYQDEGQYNKSIELLSRLIDLGYDKTRNLIRRAQLYVLINQHNRADRDLYRALPMADGDANLLMGIANVSLQTGNTRAAGMSLERALPLSPEDPLPLIRLAELYLDSEQPDKAEALLKDGAEKFPKEAALWFLYGRLAEQQDKVELAKSHYQKALELNPEFDVAFAKLYNLTRFGVGGQAFESLLIGQIKERPDNVFLKSLLAQFFYYEQRFQEAAPAYEILYEQTKEAVKKAGYARRLAETYFHFDLEKALDYVNIAENLNPEDPNILALKGWGMVQNGALEAGLKLLREAYTLNGTNLDNQYFIAFTLESLKMYSEAREVTEQLMNTQARFAYWDDTQALHARLVSNH